MTPRQLRQPLREVPVGRRDSGLTAGEATAQAHRAEAAQVLLPVGAAIKRVASKCCAAGSWRCCAGGGQPGLGLALQRRGRQQQPARTCRRRNSEPPGQPMTVPQIQFSWHKGLQGLG